MKKFLSILIAGLLAVGSTTAYAAKEPGVQRLSEDELIKTAKGAAPAHISDNATIAVVETDGNLRTLKQGSNEFTCIPDISRQETPDPFCGDKAATEWILSAIRKDERPANTAVGIGYMGKGGFHWMKDGKVVMPDEQGAKRMKEPPHWMVFFPPDTELSQFPTEPGKFGAYTMYEGTPYEHIMIYQDPHKITAKK